MVSPQVRGGRSVKIRVRAVNKALRQKYPCPRCGKKALGRTSNAQWRCNSCDNRFAGGAYSPTTSAGEVAMRILSDLRKK